ncbi:MAG TPA: hypothetical protein VG714_09245 [Acidobacteriaceae bacterium]|nr:hypothetical protein [Acidobacteriaceae bacterium]
MFELRESVGIAAPRERCFLLSTSIEIVAQTIGMRAVEAEVATADGVRRTRASGLVQAGDLVRWEGWKFGLPQHHVSLISAYEPCSFFEDRMAAGRFRTFAHGHEFEEVEGGTRLVDTVRFSLPLGVAGWVAGRVPMTPHIRGLMRRRFALLKRIAESEEWRRYIAE